MDLATRPIAQPATRSVPASWWVAKRAIDVVCGGALALIAAPVVALAALGIAIVSPGNPFYTQERVGRNGRLFRMVKLRTMVVGAHAMRAELAHLNEADGPVFKIRNDPRLHRLGAFLRRSSIDELPNFINVLSGDIALVGPRPALPSEVEHYDANALRRLSVPQGVTGLWQINGRSTTSFDEWMALDNRYASTWSPLGDLAIVLRTIPAVLRRDGAH